MGPESKWTFGIWFTPGIDGCQDIVDNLLLPKPIYSANITKFSCPAPVSDGCCCDSHCGLFHQGGAVLRSYQALVNLNSKVCELMLNPQIPDIQKKLQMMIWWKQIYNGYF